MKKELLAFLLFIFSLTSFSQQRFVEAPPETQHFSSERLRRIDNMIKRYIDAGKLNGATAFIARNGKIVYYRGFGYDDKQHKKPMKRDAIFRIASQTKASTSVAAMMLYEEGKILLDDPISKYIHSFKNAQVLDKF